MRVWLDDERPKPSDFDIHVKDPESAIALLKAGLVSHLSLDHDLGLQLGGAIRLYGCRLD
jgi:hypothetical protein